MAEDVALAILTHIVLAVSSYMVLESRHIVLAVSSYAVLVARNVDLAVSSIVLAELSCTVHASILTSIVDEYSSCKIKLCSSCIVRTIVLAVSMSYSSCSIKLYSSRIVNEYCTYSVKLYSIVLAVWIFLKYQAMQFLLQDL